MHPPLIILTLKDNVERRTRLLSTLESQGVPYELWFAVDGRSGLPQKYERLVDRQQIFKNLRRNMGDAEISCALSHHFIYREILDRDLEAAIILEDDAILDERFFDFLRVAQNFSYDLLLLDYGQAIVSRFDILKQGRKTMAYRSLVSPYYATGYVITREGAQKIVDQSLPISSLADWPIDISKIRTYAALPRIVDHPCGRTAASDIQSDRLKNPPNKRYDMRRFKLSKILDWRAWHRKLLGKRVP